MLFDNSLKTCYNKQTTSLARFSQSEKDLSTLAVHPGKLPFESITLLYTKIQTLQAIFNS